MATTKTYEMFRGDTKDFRIVYPYDITGMTFALTVKESIDDGDGEAVVAVSKLAGADTADDPANGIVYVTIPSTDSKKLHPATYQMGMVRIIDGSTPLVHTFLVTSLLVKPDVLQS
jgi:hypothetical protein